jgi:hypothetical protein
MVKQDKNKLTDIIYQTTNHKSRQLLGFHNQESTQRT